MIRKPFHFVYGIKLIATWMIIPFVLMFIPMLTKEFKAKITTQEVVLMKQAYSGYPDEYLNYETDINGKKRYVQAPVTSKEGDTVTVLLRDGDYYLTPFDSEEMNKHATVKGRFLKVCDNNFGYHVIGLAAALLLSFLLTLKKTKAIRSEHPKLSKATDIGGIIVSVIMSASLLFGVIDNTLDGLAVAYLALSLGIIYTAVFVLAWAVQSIIAAFAK